MSNFCIISEFNPLHNGHAYLLRQARELGADTVTCVMSGNATQRGELAVTDKYIRAEAAVKVGADLVVELPFPWCSASADYFAAAAVSIAAGFGDVLLFGSECGDTEKLSGAAEVCETKEFGYAYSAKTRNGSGSAAAFLECLAERGFSDFSSNDLLGIAYIRAIKRMEADIKPMTVKRLGAAYGASELNGGELPSAAAVRAIMARGELDGLGSLMPSGMAELLRREAEAGRLTDGTQVDAAVLAFFRLADAEALENIAETQGGIANRLISAAKRSVTAEEMYARARIKRYTDAKIRRAALFCMTGTEQSALKTLPGYTTLLAANSKGRALLSKNRKAGGIPVITKPADAPRGAVQYALSAKLDSLYGLARKERLTSESFFQKGAYILK